MKKKIAIMLLICITLNIFTFIFASATTDVASFPNIEQLKAVLYYGRHSGNKYYDHKNVDSYFAQCLMGTTSPILSFNGAYSFYPMIEYTIGDYHSNVRINKSGLDWVATKIYNIEPETWNTLKLNSMKSLSDYSFYHCYEDGDFYISNFGEVGRDDWIESIDNIEQVDDYYLVSYHRSWVGDNEGGEKEYAVLKLKDFDGQKYWSIYYAGDSSEVFNKINNIKVTLNGKELSFNQAPIEENDRILVPMRAIFEALGAEVLWDDSTKTAIAQKYGTEIKITIDSNIMYKNGEIIKLDTPAQLINGNTMVPVRAISEAFGCHVVWDEENQTVKIASDTV